MKQPRYLKLVEVLETGEQKHQQELKKMDLSVKIKIQKQLDTLMFSALENSRAITLEELDVLIAPFLVKEEITFEK